MLRIPAILDNEDHHSLDVQPIPGIDGARVAELALTPLIKTHALLRAAPQKLRRLQDTPAHQILRAFKDAAALLRGGDWGFASLSRREYCSAVAATTGLPRASMGRELDDVADLLEHLGDVVRVQLPASEENPLDTHRYAVRGNEVGYFPAGSSLLVKVPGNVPTICLYWLIPLALKRPVILVPPLEDPFTHWVLVQALRTVAPWLSSCVQFLPCEEQVWRWQLDHVDQIILSQSQASLVHRSPALVARTHFIHYGRTKLLLPEPWTEEALDVAVRRMTWNHGRTCTGLTSVIVAARGREFCEGVAGRLRQRFGDDFAANVDRLPLFPVERARQLDEAIEAFIRGGEAEDVTRRVTGRPRLWEVDRRAMLMPTVLWMKQRHGRAFGLELPFPFITIAEAEDEERMLRLARDSLILSVMGGTRDLLQRLCYDNSIRKVFHGAQVERGYNALDPHEGYLADFLYQKKAVFL